MKSIHYRQIAFIILIFLAFILVVGALFLKGASAAVVDDGADVKKILKRYNNEKIFVDREQQIQADVMLIDGSITIEGEVFGDIIAVWSDVKIKRRGRVYGNVIIYHGEVKKDEDSQIAGDIITISSWRVRRSDYREIMGFKTDYHIFSGDRDDSSVIEDDETVSGDVIVFKQAMIIRGKVDGDVICFDGRLKVDETAAIDGHLVNYEGSLEQDEAALVTGEIFNNGSHHFDEEKDYYEEDDEEIRDDIERKFLHNRTKHKSDIFRFWGDVTIERDEVIKGSVVVMKGTAVIKGEVDGEVVSIFGNVEMDSTGYVTGDVVSVGGKIYRDRSSFIGGDVVQTSWTGVQVDNDEQHVRAGLTGVHVSPKDEDNWDERDSNDHYAYDSDFETDKFMFRYNRVEGLFLGLRLPKYDWYREKRFSVSLYGHAGYGFQSKRGRYQIGLERRFFHTSIGAEAHDLTDTQDKWIISTFENSLAAGFLREDFHDFYRRTGVSAYLIQNFTSHFSITAGYRKDQYEQMKKETNWSVFGGDKKFRSNPLIDEIEMRSAFLKVTLDTRNDWKYPTQGWFINFDAELARREFNEKYEDIDFDRFILDIRRYQPIGYGENLDFRLRAGTARGLLPIQFHYDLGGISTLRGYRFKEFPDGDRMVLGNVEYRIYGPKGRVNDFMLGGINIILFADAGLVWQADDKSTFDASFEDLRWEDLMTDVGIAFSNYEGNVRFTIAKQLDDKDEPLVLTFRIRRPF